MTHHVRPLHSVTVDNARPAAAFGQALAAGLLRFCQDGDFRNEIRERVRREVDAGRLTGLTVFEDEADRTFVGSADLNADVAGKNVENGGHTILPWRPVARIDLGVANRRPGAKVSS